MGAKEKLLKYSPIWLQNFLISTYGNKLIKQRYGKTYYEARKGFLGKDLSHFAELQSEQNTLLQDFVKFAIAKSTFYRSLYADIDVTQIQDVESLATLPIVDKELLRTNIDDVYTLAPEDGIVSFTGGTTGKSLQVVFTHDDFQTRMAYLDAFKMRLGIDPFKSKKATFSGREFTRGWAGKRGKVFWRDNRAYNQRLYSTFDLIEENLPLYIRDLNQFKPNVINGFVSAIYEVAQFIERNSLVLEFEIDAIFTTSETLLPHHKEKIEAVFDTKVYNQYASAEGAPFITECTHSNLHYNMDTGVIETFQTEAGTEMLVTSFHTHGTPLIRYRIGDLVTFKEGVCPCGSAFPLVEEIEGRKVDYLLSKQFGKVTLSHLADVIKGLPNCVKSVQFHQPDIDNIVVHLNVDKHLYDDKAENKIQQALVYRFGDDMQFGFKLVDAIAREKSGKYALIKNSIKAQS